MWFTISWRIFSWVMVSSVVGSCRWKKVKPWDGWMKHWRLFGQFSWKALYHKFLWNPLHGFWIIISLGLRYILCQYPINLHCCFIFFDYFRQFRSLSFISLLFSLLQKKMLLQSMCLGNTPPIITMIRRLAQPMEGDDLVHLFLPLMYCILSTCLIFLV